MFSLFSLILGLFTLHFANSTTYTFTENLDSCEWNPFRGMFGSPAWGINTDFPTSLEFYYIPLDSTVVGLDTYDWSTLETYLEATKGRDRHSVVRFWVDYPAVRSAVPEYLLEAPYNLAFTTYTDWGGGESPDYSDTNFQDMLLDFIAAFGAAYDGDDRIYVIQLGILGFWGEWHTYPCDSCRWDSTFENAVNQAWVSAFSTTQLNVRYASTLNSNINLGYHDDSFCYSTVDDSVSWFFYTELQNTNNANKYETVVIGGELRPELQTEIFKSTYTTGTYAQEWDSTVDTTHVSYMLNSAAFSGSGYTDVDEYNTAKIAAQRLGYAISIDTVSIFFSGNNMEVSVTLQNTGVAPFYYDLQLEMSVGSAYTHTFSNSLSTTDFLGGTTKTLTHYIYDYTSYFSAGSTYNLDLSLVSSLAYASNPVRFCNDEWDDVNNVVSVAFEVEANPVPSPTPEPVETVTTGSSSSDSIYIVTDTANNWYISVRVYGTDCSTDEYNSNIQSMEVMASDATTYNTMTESEWGYYEYDSPVQLDYPLSIRMVSTDGTSTMLNLITSTGNGNCFEVTSLGSTKDYGSAKTNNSSGGSNNNSKTVIIGVMVATGALILCVLTGVIYYFAEKRSNKGTYDKSEPLMVDYQMQNEMTTHVS